MKRRYVLAGLGVLAMLAVASPALGGPSLRKLVKKEVAKQLAGKTGPQGFAGANGVNGTNGTARAYQFVDHFFCSGGPPANCVSSPGRNVGSVVRLASTGVYCASVAGADPNTEAPVATVDWGETNAPAVSTVVWNSQNNACSASQFEFRTFESGGASNNVSFSFVIP